MKYAKILQIEEISLFLKCLLFLSVIILRNIFLRIIFPFLSTNNTIEMSHLRKTDKQ